MGSEVAERKAEKREVFGQAALKAAKLKDKLFTTSTLRPYPASEMKYFIKSLKFMNGIKELASGKAAKLNFLEQTSKASAFHLNNLQWPLAPTVAFIKRKGPRSATHRLFIRCNPPRTVRSKKKKEAATIKSDTRSVAVKLFIAIAFII